MGNLEFKQNHSSEVIAVFAEVLLPVAIAKTFTYRVPRALEAEAEIGRRVVVQFGQRKILTGVIAGLHHQPPVVYTAKPIQEILDKTPHMLPVQLDLLRWMADYYMCTIGEVFNAALPSGLKLSSESKIQLHPQFDAEQINEDFSEQEEKLISALRYQSVLAYSDVGRILNVKSYNGVIKALLEKEAIMLFEEVHQRYMPKTEKYVRLHDRYAGDKSRLQQLINDLDKQEKQQNVLLAYLRSVPVLRQPEANADGMKKKELLKGDLSASSFNTLVRNGVLVAYDQVVSRIPTGDASVEGRSVLSDAQEKARNEILRQFETMQSVLLQGVTGSGKTEIYISLIRDVLEQGGQVLYLLPEIALTTQIVVRLQRVFGNSLGVYHSRHSDNERVEVWRGLLSGRFSVVVGVRSAIFLPFRHLSLIVIDEEHEPSYKQFDPAPRYHARDTALVLARLHAAKVLLGSATPSLETYYQQEQGKFGLVQLTERYRQLPLPDITFADLTQARKQHQLKGDFTNTLVEAIGETLANKEQVIIFQNRRGYAPFVTCEECGWIPKCLDCAVSLTYHLNANYLRCHYCGHRERLPSSCPACGATRLLTRGFGTEKLEEDLKLLFPQARTQRMDFDTTRSKYGYQQIIGAFESGQVDILVGTQMVSKGLDFDKVRLVGIFDIDRMLHFPDFRASERTFQLAVQVSGRAGRKAAGSVIVQTANVQQPILGLVQQQHYDAFYRSEIGERLQYKYPPFYRLIKIVLRHKEQQKVDKAAHAYFKLLKKALRKVELIAPHEPMLAKLRGYYQMQLYIKLKRGAAHAPVVKQAAVACVQ